jgi:hypothetical protein
MTVSAFSSSNLALGYSCSSSTNCAPGLVCDSNYMMCMADYDEYCMSDYKCTN